MTVVRLLDGTKVYLHATIEYFSRRILAWRATDGFTVATTMAILQQAVRGAVTRDELPTLVADAGVEYINAGVDGLIESGMLSKMRALRDVTSSSSMIEAWWRLRAVRTASCGNCWQPTPTRQAALTLA